MNSTYSAAAPACAPVTINSECAGAANEHGEVFTRRWIVDLILDMVGYRTDADLATMTIVEPAAGCGAFVVPIVERLAESCARHGRSLAACEDAIRGFELLTHNAEVARAAVEAKLGELGETGRTAQRLAECWVAAADFLLLDHKEGSADFVVGNPPYVRIEQMPDEVGESYRSVCSTMRGRADLFVGFFEKGLKILAPGGRLGFICADRWMRNQYGSRLRELVAEHYAVEALVELHDAKAFEQDVSAYPAITVLKNAEQGPVRVARASGSFDEAASRRLLGWLASDATTHPSDEAFEGSELAAWFSGGDHWPSGSTEVLELVADLESRYRPLEDSLTGTRVGIGVATGCDEVYITTERSGVEEDRLLPLLTAADIASGSAKWSGRHLINPWEDGRLVDLGEFPGLKDYFEEHSLRLRGRHVARKRPAAWYRTIDKVAPGLREKPKLLMPDIKSAAHPVLDRGEFYPHHNLYWIVSEKWDLEVLGGLLLSDFANLLVGAYCVKMRNGTYRFQAQYLRKIRVPAPDSIDAVTAAALTEAFRSRDRAEATAAAAVPFGIGTSDLAAAVA